ncbi:SatD family protein [Janibacter sp. GXQ6167]|uniref:SatD family protein n=1 Tax=Janibacter sp. GXQ6167 TaxID=3240791 RepID=UPI0035253ACE
MKAVASLLGDVVGSREAPDRAALHRGLVEAMEQSNADRSPIDPLHLTVGDEFQAAYTTVGEAIGAAADLQHRLRPDIDVRIGIGWGGITRLDATIQDGPAWWSARRAIEEAKTLAHERPTAHVRVRYQREDPSGPPESAINAALDARDCLIARIRPRAARILHGLARGHSRSEIAEREGVSASAISQQITTNDLETILRLDAALEEVT